MKDIMQKRTRTLREAGGYRVADGCIAYPNTTWKQREPWIKAVRRFIRRKMRAKDDAVIQMLLDAECEWMTFDQRIPFHHWPSQTPTLKAQSLIGYIMKQRTVPKGPFSLSTRWQRRRFDVVDILAVGIGTILLVEYGGIPTPPKVAYFRSVQVGRALRRLLNPEFRTYSRDSLRYPGMIQTQRVCLTNKVRFRSRYACQRLEEIIRKQAGWFIERYGVEIGKTHRLL